jgi:hypothetical protein
VIEGIGGNEEGDVAESFFPIHTLGLQSSCLRIPVVNVEEADEDPTLVNTATDQKY